MTHETIILPPAEIDLATVGGLDGELLAASPHGVTIVDCTSVRFCGVAGLHLLVRHRRRLGESLRIVNAPRVLRRLCDAAGLADLLDDAPVLLGPPARHGALS